LQRGHLALEGGLAEGELILLGLIPFRDSLLAREVVVRSEKPAELRVRAVDWRRIAAARRKRCLARLRLRGDGGLSAGLKPGLFAMLLKLRRQRISELLLIAEQLPGFSRSCWRVAGR